MCFPIIFSPPQLWQLEICHKAFLPTRQNYIFPFQLLLSRGSILGRVAWDFFDLICPSITPLSRRHPPCTRFRLSNLLRGSKLFIGLCLFRYDILGTWGQVMLENVTLLPICRWSTDVYYIMLQDASWIIIWNEMSYLIKGNFKLSLLLVCIGKHE